MEKIAKFNKLADQQHDQTDESLIVMMITTM